MYNILDNFLSRVISYGGYKYCSIDDAFDFCIKEEQKFKDTFKVKGRDKSFNVLKKEYYVIH